MSLANDLLHQAGDLARKEPKRPRQASLRRSVSTSYYALFHLFIDEGTRRLAKGTGQSALRQSIARAYQHVAMKEAARGFANANPAAWATLALGTSIVSADLRFIAKTFVELQESRHEADYNLAHKFTRRECLELWNRSDDAFQRWRSIRRSAEAEVFLLALLLHRQMRE